MTNNNSERRATSCATVTSSIS